MKDKPRRNTAAADTGDETYLSATCSDGISLVLDFQQTAERILLNRLDSISSETETNFQNPQGLREHLRALRR